MSETKDATRVVTCNCGHVADRHHSPGNLNQRWHVHSLLGQCRDDPCDCMRFSGQEHTTHAAVCLRADGHGLRYLVPFNRKERLFFFLVRWAPIPRFWTWLFYGWGRR